MPLRGLVLGLLLAFACAGTGLALADWQRFVEPRSGAAVDVPPGFAIEGGTRSGGRLFRSSDGTAMMRIGGHAITPGGFGDDVAETIAADQDNGWSITFQSQTDGWAAWSASRDGTILKVRAVLACDGAQVAIVRISYPALADAPFEPIADQVAGSLAQDGACF